MNRLTLLAADAASLGDELDALLTAQRPSVVALTRVSPAHAARLAGGRGIKCATHRWLEGEDSGVALLWRPTLAIESLDRLEFQQGREPSGALRITLRVQGHTISVYCTALSPDWAIASGQQARLAAQLDARPEPTLVACAGIVSPAGQHWSRYEDAWSAAMHRVISLAAPADVGLAAQRAFGIAGGPNLRTGPRATGPAWLISPEFEVAQARAISGLRAPLTPARIAEVALRAGLSERRLAAAL